MTGIALDVERTNDVCDALGHHHRRFVLADLSGRVPPVGTGGLAARAAEWERDRGGPRTVSRKRVEIELHHRHLPKLAGADLLTYDPSELAVVDWPDLDLPDGWPSDPAGWSALVARVTE